MHASHPIAMSESQEAPPATASNCHTSYKSQVGVRDRASGASIKRFGRKKGASGTGSQLQILAMQSNSKFKNGGYREEADLLDTDRGRIDGTRKLHVDER